MVDLVLKDPGDVSGGPEADALARHQRSVDRDAQRPPDGRNYAGYAEAAFFRDVSARAAAQTRIHKRQQPVPGVGKHHPQRHADLDSGKPDTLRVAHRHRHIGNEPANGGVHPGDRLTPPAEDGAFGVGDGDDAPQAPARGRVAVLAWSVRRKGRPRSGLGSFRHTRDICLGTAEAFPCRGGAGASEPGGAR